jgi:beta-1,4-mannosyl-glycoprotein beta-1,4-N-acetylglucosaminyltransferase
MSPVESGGISEWMVPGRAIAGWHLASVLLALETSPLVIGGKSFSNLTELCSVYGLEPAGGNHYVPRVFDFFLAGYELDMMEIRLQTLAEVVEAFVIVESRMTFRGQRKSLSVPSLYHQLPGEVIQKIHYVVLDKLEGKGEWDREHCQRQAMIAVGIKQLGSDVTASDVIIFSDCDEIPKPWFVHAIKHCDGFKFPVRMRAQLRYYSFDRVIINHGWSQPTAVMHADAMDRSAEDIRNGNATVYSNSSWHCSYCFDSVALIHKQLGSFSHSEHDNEANKDVARIVSRVRMCLNLFDRHNNGTSKTMVNDTHFDIPDYIMKNPTRFNYMLNRDVVDAGFKDVHICP